MEDEPVVHINTSDGESMEVNRDNGTLFTFTGRTALSGGFEVESSLLSHVFICSEQTEQGMSGSYIFSASEAFEALRDFFMENAFPMHLNLRQVAQCDVDAYELMLSRESSDLDGIPEDWQ